MQSDLSPASSVASSHMDPVDEQSTSDCDSISDDDDNYARKYRDRWVSELTRQEGQELNTYSRASLSLESPSPRSLRPDKRKHPSRFQSNDPIPVEDPVIPILPCRYALCYPRRSGCPRSTECDPRNITHPQHSICRIPSQGVHRAAIRLRHCIWSSTHGMEWI